MSVIAARHIVRILIFVLGLVWPLHASAKTFRVNTTADTVDKKPGDGTCADVNDQCSLRAAVMEANALSGQDTILLGKGIYLRTIDNLNGDENASAEGDLDIVDDVIIQGISANQSIIDADQKDRVFHVLVGRAEFRNVTIRNGFYTDFSFGFGGGINQESGTTLVINNSVLSDNNAFYGGALNVGEGITTIENTALIHNRASGGGAISACVTYAQMNIINSTISGNYGETGGAIFTQIWAVDRSGTYATGLHISNTTITDNESVITGGIFNIGTGVLISNSILAGNRGRAPDCNPSIKSSQGHNLLGNSFRCNFLSAEGDKIGTPDAPINPLLAPLADNGGPSPTHALLPKSPAIEAGNPAPPGSVDGACEATDQRGVPRAARCDIGAFESAALGAINDSTGVTNPFAGATSTASADPGTEDSRRDPMASTTQTSPRDSGAADIPRNPFVGESHPTLPDTQPSAQDESSRTLSVATGPRAEVNLSEAEEDAKRPAVLTLRTDEAGRPYYYISNDFPEGGAAVPEDYRWLGLRNLRFDAEGRNKVAIVVGTAATVIAGAVNLYLRSMGLFGAFFSFPLWSPVDPVPVLMLAARERKRRRTQGQRDIEMEDRDGRLGRLLDDGRHSA
jgi:CSLREA domain-containing protein